VAPSKIGMNQSRPRNDGTPDDEQLVAQATAGDARALDRLLRRHQAWVFNLAMYMLQARADAEDATQEILLKVTTALSAYRGESAFRTWAYRIAVNHVLDRRRSRAEHAVHGFDCFARYLATAPDDETAGAPSATGVTEPGLPPQERHVLTEEARRACTMGMLLCLDRDQRVTLLLGEILELGDVAAAEVLGISRANFRQRLARARGDLGRFLAGQCGLTDPRNPCRCARKTRAFIRDGIVDPARLQFVDAHVARARAAAATGAVGLQVLERQAALGLRELYPPFRAPDVAARVRALITAPEPRRWLDLAPPETKDTNHG